MFLIIMFYQISLDINYYNHVNYLIIMILIVTDLLSQTNKQTNKQQHRYKGSYVTSLIANLLPRLLSQAMYPIIFLYKKRKQEYAWYQTKTRNNVTTIEQTHSVYSVVRVPGGFYNISLFNAVK